MNIEIKKLLGFTAVILILLISVDFMGYKILNHLFFKMKSGREYNTRLAMKEVKSDLIFIGASQCVGNYDSNMFRDSLGIDSYNAGMGGQGLDYQIIVANTLIKRKKPKIIIWDFDPKLLANDSGVYLKLDLGTYYNDNDDVKKAIDKIDQFAFLKNISKSYCYNSRLMQFLNANVGKKEKSNGYTPFKCNKQGELKVQKLDRYPEFGTDTERKINLMTKNLNAWKEMGIKIYVFVSPVYSKINYKVNGIEAVEKICKDQQVYFKDFSQMEGVYDNPNYFRDEIHLCRIGSKIYSSEVIKLLDYNKNN